jgi:purine-binding chemotaxis protein CheW
MGPRPLFTPAERAVLEARQLRLAARVITRGAEPIRLVQFRRAMTLYAMPAAGMLSVRALPKLSRLPGAPPQLVGLAHLDGHVVGVLDLERLVVPSAPMPPRAWCAWIHEKGKSALLLADELMDLIDVPPSALDGGEVRGAFTGPLAARIRAVLPGPSLVIDAGRLLEPELFRTLS